MPVTLTTELEAVNVMLEMIGLAPINTFVGNSNADVDQARGVLARISREVQNDGWDFNIEEDYPLQRDGANKIPLAQNLLRVKVPRAKFPSVDVVRRGNWLYDKKGHTFVFDRDLKGTVVLGLDFDDLPEAARNYIAIRAARTFQDSVGSSEVIEGLTRDDELRAHGVLRRAEGDTGEYNILDHDDVAIPALPNMIRFQG